MLKGKIQVETGGETLSPRDIMGRPLYTSTEFRNQMWELANRQGEYGIEFKDVDGNPLSANQVRVAVVADALAEGRHEEAAGRVQEIISDTTLAAAERDVVYSNLGRTLVGHGLGLLEQRTRESVEVGGRLLQLAGEVTSRLPEEAAGREKIIADSRNGLGVAFSLLGDQARARQNLTGLPEEYIGPRTNLGCVEYRGGQLGRALTRLDEEINGECLFSLQDSQSADALRDGLRRMTATKK